MKEFWDKRYTETSYAYGVNPNVFFKDSIDTLPTGRLLLPAEGEGRNAVYAAKRGWEVAAFDSSSVAKNKALRLAKSKAVAIDYSITDVMAFTLDTKVDVIALIYAHFPAPLKAKAHQHIMQFLKPGGTVIFEAFSRNQLGNSSGGPKHADMLFDLNAMQTEFPMLDFSLLKEETITLNEGAYHNGKAVVIRFVGRLK